MPRIPWVLFDPIANETLSLPINPNSGGSPARRKTLSTRTTTAGQALYFEGADEPRTFSVQGVILTQDHYEDLDRWVDEKHHQIRVTDDLGRVFWVYLVSFEPERVRKPFNPWYHTYTLQYTELDI